MGHFDCITQKKSNKSNAPKVKAITMNEVV